MTREKSLIFAMLALLLILAVSAIHPYDRTTWFMEVAPILVVVPVLAATFSRFPLTTLLYVLIFIHALVLITGGEYSYARVPLGARL
jgi:putative membrane protein